MRKIDSERQAQAQAALLAGQGVNEVAKQYKLAPSTVSILKKKIDTQTLQAATQAQKVRIVDLIEGHLRESLNGATNIAKITADNEWLAQQSAADLGVFYGILTDKAVRLLEASQYADPSASAEVAV